MASSSSVQSIFETILQRPADPGEILTFLDDSVTESAVAAAIASSPGALAEPAAVIRIYEAVFGRKPDAGGLNYWVDRLVTEPGFDLLKLAQGFVNSNEFRDRYGVSGLDDVASKQALIEALYKNVLDRQPDASGLSFWLDTGYTPAQLLLFFSESKEFIERSAAKIQSFFIDIALGGTNDPSKSDSDDFTGSIFDIRQPDTNTDDRPDIIDLVDSNSNSNRAPTDIALTNIIVAENAAGVIVGTLSTADSNVDDRHIYTVNSSSFEVLDGALKLKDGISFDHEKTSSVNVTVTSTDIAGATIAKTFAIIITDVNEAPTAVSLTGTVTSTAENGRAVKVADLAATDDQLSTNVFSVSGTDAGVFEVRNGNQLWFKGGANYETKSSYTVVVDVDDANVGGTPDASSAPFTLAITDVNEAPTAIVVSNQVALPENTNGQTLIADLSVTDPDVLNRSFSRNNTLSVDDARFEIVNGQLFLKAGSSIDFESDQTIKLKLTATDANDAALTYSQDLTVTISDVNEAPTAVSLTGTVTSTAENGSALKVADLAATDDKLGTNVFSVSGTDAGAFEVRNGNQLWFKGGANYETKSSYTVVVDVDDANVGGTPDASSAPFTLAITDVNEAPTAIVVSNQVALPENTNGQTLIADLSVTDPDVLNRSFSRNNTLSVDDARFEIVNGQLFLKAGSSIDFESDQTIKLKLTATDANDAALTYSQDLTVTISDVNEAPTAVSLTGTVTSTAENGSALKVADLAATDDKLGTNVFSVSGTDAGAFEVRNGNQLWFKGGANYETKSSYTVVVDVDDADVGGTPDASSAPFTLAITDVNEAPTAIVVSNQVALPENTNGQTLIADLSVTDPDVLNRSFSRNNTLSVDDARFEIVNGQLFLKAGSSIDFESDQTIKLKLTATDANDAALTYSQDLTVTISDVNEAPTAIVVSNQVALPENTNGQTLIADLSVTDPDVLNRSFSRNNTLSVDDARFEIVNGQLFLKAGSSIDFESDQTIKLKLTATDANDAALTYSQDLTVTISDVNEAPTAVSLTGTVTSTAENGSALKVADLAATDDKLGTNVFSVSGTDAGAFEVRNGNQLWFKGGANYETKSSYTVVVDVDDADVGGTPDASSAPFTLAITDVNEAPTAIVVSNQVALPENTNGQTLIADLSVTDPDVLNRSFSRNNTLSVDDARFEIVNGQLFLKAGSSIDFESDQTIKLKLTATDANDAALTYSQDLTVTISDVNEAPTAVSLTGTVTSTAENGSALKVADLAATDDKLGTNVFSVSGTDAGAFEVRNGNQLWFKGGANYETKSSYTVVVDVDDADVGGTPDASSAPFTLAITDVNEAPTAIVVSNQVALPENTNGQTLIADLSVTDPDVLNRSFSRNNTLSVDDARFEIVNGQLFLKAGSSIDFESDQTIKLKLTATDANDAALTYSQDLTVTISDVNEAPTAVSLTGTVTSTAENGSALKVADLAATDDKLGTNVFSVSGTDAGAFEVRNGNQLWFKGGANYETKSSYTVVVDVDDANVGGTPDASSAPFTLAITNVNEAPTAVSLTGTVTSTAENGSALKVADLAATDDQLGTNVFSVRGTDASAFEVRNGNQLWFKGGADYETKSSYTVVVDVDDANVGGTPDASSAPFTLAITDVSGFRYVGSYRVSDGQFWGNNPPVYSAKEVAVLLFGGPLSKYVISIDPSRNPNSITGTGWYDGWGQRFTVFDDDFKRDSPPAGYKSPDGDAWSAYVADHIDFSKVNYVWEII